MLYSLIRGGGWDDIAADGRVAYRDYCHPTSHYDYLGFIIVKQNSKRT
jgi:hypothetical protein